MQVRYQAALHPETVFSRRREGGMILDFGLGGKTGGTSQMMPARGEIILLTGREGRDLTDLGTTVIHVAGVLEQACSGMSRWSRQDPGIEQSGGMWDVWPARGGGVPSRFH